MVSAKEVKAIMLCEGKSFEQALFYLLRFKNGFSLSDIGSIIDVSKRVLNKAENPRNGYKRLPISIAKKILDFYSISIYEYDYLKNKVHNINISVDYIVGVYQKVFNYSKGKAMLYVHSKINGFSTKEYKKMIRISRVNTTHSKLNLHMAPSLLILNKHLFSC